MGLMDWLKGRREKLKPASGRSILACIEAGEDLPDEARLAATRKVPWAAGAFDGVVGHHMGPSDDDAEPKAIMKALKSYCAAPSTGTRQAMYDALIGISAVSNADKVLEAVRADDKLDQGRLYEACQWLVREGTDREPVKLGLAVLGAFRQPADEPLFRTLGRHEEFTLFAAIALANVAADPEVALWELASVVTGWGRVQIIERLEGTQNAQIKAWLLREGSTNAVMNEYTAYTCAVTGGLREALSAASVDRALLTGAGNILQALMSDGPALTLADYEDADAAIALYLDHVARGASEPGSGDLLDFHTVRMIAEARPANAARCQTIERHSRWPDLVRTGLRAADFYAFDKAVRAAEALGIDSWSERWARVQEKTLDAQRWWYIVKEKDHARFAQVVALAEATLPLAEIATGPGEEMGLGPDFVGDSCLAYVLQELGTHPGVGMKLVAAALKSRVIRTRNAAANVLEAWKGPYLQDAVKAALKQEPDDDLRKRLANLAQGQSN